MSAHCPACGALLSMWAGSDCNRCGWEDKPLPVNEPNVIELSDAVKATICLPGLIEAEELLRANGFEKSARAIGRSIDQAKVIINRKLAKSLGK